MKKLLVLVMLLIAFGSFAQEQERGLLEVKVDSVFSTKWNYETGKYEYDKESTDLLSVDLNKHTYIYFSPEKVFVVYQDTLININSISPVNGLLILEPIPNAPIRYVYGFNGFATYSELSTHNSRYNVCTFHVVSIVKFYYDEDINNKLNELKNSLFIENSYKKL